MFGNKLKRIFFVLFLFFCSSCSNYVTPDNTDDLVSDFDINDNICEANDNFKKLGSYQINERTFNYYLNDGFYAKGQDAAEYNNNVVSFDSNSKMKIQNYVDNSVVCNNIDIDKSNIIKPHCNSVSFGGFYSEDDEYPLIYLNAYNSLELPLGTCYVHRIFSDNNNYSTDLIQTINIDFIDDEIWTNGNDTRPYGNFLVDKENNRLIVYTLKDSENITRFFVFELPLFTKENIILTKDDIIDSFDLCYIPFVQGNCFYKNKIIVLSGYGTDIHPGQIYIIDIRIKSVLFAIDLNSIGICIEPEFVFVANKSLFFGQSQLYKFDSFFED